MYYDVSLLANDPDFRARSAAAFAVESYGDISPPPPYQWSADHSWQLVSAVQKIISDEAPPPEVTPEAEPKEEPQEPPAEPQEPPAEPSSEPLTPAGEPPHEPPADNLGP
jgi:hypothetical protein